MSNRRGTTLIELLSVLSIVGLLLALVLPSMGEITGQRALRAASFDVAAVFHMARSRAALRQRDVGVKWISIGDDVTFSLYEDGNGNGVRTAEIRTGVDRFFAGPFSMKGHYPGVSFSFVPGFGGLDPGGSPIGDLNDPIRFGRSDICTFSPDGHASPGTVYLSNKKHRQAAVRVNPISARVHFYEWMGKPLGWLRR